MKTVGILEPSDRIEAGDLVRQLALSYEGQSDYLATNATYGGGRINRLGWIAVGEFCPAWIGKTVGEFNRALRASHEFVRGPVPKAHLERTP